MPLQVDSRQVLTYAPRFYRSESHLQITHRRRVNAYALPPAHQKLLFDSPISLLSTFTKLDDCISENADFLEAILSTAFLAFDTDPESLPTSTASMAPELLTEVRDQIDKIRSVLRQFVRDWSAEGHEERGVVYGRMLRALNHYYPDIKKRAEVKVVVPGSGLGRLALDIAGMGFWSQGNEWSYSMLAASQFALNWYVSPPVGGYSADEAARKMQGSSQSILLLETSLTGGQEMNKCVGCRFRTSILRKC